MKWCPISCMSIADRGLFNRRSNRQPDYKRNKAQTGYGGLASPLLSLIAGLLWNIW